jgi:hypothetical protein
VGSAVGVGVGSTDGDGEADGSSDGLGLALSSGVAEGSGVGVGAVVGSVVGVAETPELGRGVAVAVPGGAVGTAETGVSVGVATGGRVARGAGWKAGSCATTCDAANTKAPPRSATVMIVTIRVPVVRMAPRMTCVRRSDSQERCSCRRRRSSNAATRIRSSRSGIGRGVPSEPRSPRTRVLPPISAAHTGQPLTWAASRAASVGSSSSSRKASIRSRARAQSKTWSRCGFVTSHT